MSDPQITTAEHGPYLVAGDEIETPNLRADGDCPVELERQDGHVIGVLEGGFTVAIEGDRLGHSHVTALLDLVAAALELNGR